MLETLKSRHISRTETVENLIILGRARLYGRRLYWSQSWFQTCTVHL